MYSSSLTRSDPPLAPAADLDALQVTAAEQGVNLAFEVANSRPTCSIVKNLGAGGGSFELLIVPTIITRHPPGFASLPPPTARVAARRFWM
jgi:hypothetical protein